MALELVYGADEIMLDCFFGITSFVGGIMGLYLEGLFDCLFCREKRRFLRFLKDRTGAGSEKVFPNLIDSQIGRFRFLAGYNHSTIKAEVRSKILLWYF